MYENLTLKAKIYHYAILLCVFLFLVLPIAATFLYSISSSWGVSILPDGLTLKWYKQAFYDERFLNAMFRSLFVCFAAIFLTIILIFPLVFAVNYYFHRWKNWANFCVIVPFAVPSIVSCVGLLQLYSETLGGTAILLIFSYFTIVLPFIYRALDNAFASIKMEELLGSNAMLGGNLFGGIFKLIMPQLKRGILIAIFLSFSFLMGEFLYANVLVGGTYESLQVYLYNIRGQSGHYSSAIVIIYFIFIFAATFIASFIKE